MAESLLRNKDELKNLKIPAHKYTKQEFHSDMDWIRDEHNKYSMKFTDHNPDLDETIVKLCCIISNNCKSKSKLLKAAKLVNAYLYFDENFKQIPKSEKDLIEFFDKLENVLISSQSIEGFALGMRFRESISEITADMSGRQSRDLRSAINDYFYAQKHVHYELGLNGRFIPLKDYFNIRGKEGAWMIFYLLIEYVQEVSLTDKIYGKSEIKQFLEQMNRNYLSLGDSFKVKSKLAQNDISSHIITYSASNLCSLQESVDMNDIVILNSKLRATEMLNNIMKNDLLNSPDVERFINGLFDSMNSLLQFYYEFLGYEIKDGFVYHKDH